MWIKIILGVSVTAGLGMAQLKYAGCDDLKDSDFKKTTLDNSGLKEPNLIQASKDGRVFYGTRMGIIKVYKPDLLSSVESVRLKVSNFSEEGLIGMQLDPQFPTQPYVYLFYSDPNANGNQLSRFSVVGDKIDVSTEKKLLKVAAQRKECCHTAGDMAFDAQGNLWISAGDNQTPFQQDGYAPLNEGNDAADDLGTAANTNDLRGKILRITPKEDGTYDIPKGNFKETYAADYTPAELDKIRPEIYSMGHRNPYRFGLNPNNGWMLEGEVGPDANADKADRGPRGYDEYNVINKPGFYGYPMFIGNNFAYNKWNFSNGSTGPKFDVEKPMNTSPHNTGVQHLPKPIPATIWYPYADKVVGAQGKQPDNWGGGSRTAMGGPYIMYKNAGAANRMPPHLNGKYLIYEWSRRWMKVVTLDSEGKIADIAPIFSNMTFKEPIDMDYGPDGTLYVVEYGEGYFDAAVGGGVYQIEYKGNCLPKDVVTEVTPKLKDNHSKNVVIGNLGFARQVLIPTGSTAVKVYDVAGKILLQSTLSAIDNKTFNLPDNFGNGLYRFVFERN